MDANCILRAITLRGIGSYLHGARLKIRPLTILCGTNGSGKSTWLKALNLLKDAVGDSSCEEPFPFYWPRPDGQRDDENINDIFATNAFMHSAADELENAFLTNNAVDDRYGPPCTISLEFEAARDFAVPTNNDFVADGENGLERLLSCD